jgi:hypothetical protein
MKKIVVYSVAALSMAACSESITNPSADPGAPLFFASHSSILAPIVSSSVDGYDVTISWTWSDPDDGWDLVSFTLKRDGVALPVAIANAKPYSVGTELSRSVEDADLEDGTYEYCVEVMAKYSDVIPALTHHNRSCVMVYVGSSDVFTHAVSNALSSGTAISALPVNANRWDLVFALLRNGTPMDCSNAPVQLTNVTVTGQVSGGGALTFHGTVECSDADTSMWKVQVDNPSKGTASSGTFTFGLTWDGTDHTTANGPQPWSTTAPSAGTTSGPSSGRK